MNSFFIIKVMVFNKLKIKYKRSYLGLFWSMLNPLLTVGVISLVFSHMLGVPFKQFVVFFFPGILAWNLFVGCLNGGVTCFTDNESYIKKIKINKLIFPAVVVGVNFVDYIFAFFTMLIVFAINGIFPSVALISYVVSMVLLLLFVYGLALILGVLGTFFRDMVYIVSVLLQLMFYLTPVLYPASFFAKKGAIVQDIFKLNPMSYFISLFRLPVHDGVFPHFHTFLITFSLAGIFLCIGLCMYKRFKNKLIFLL